MASPQNQFIHATTPVAASGDILLDSLTGDYKAGGALGTGAVLSYSFPWSASSTAVWATPVYSDLNEPAYGFGLNPMQQAAFRSALATWSQVANLQFDEVPDTPTAVGDIRIAWTQLPNPGSEAWTWQSPDYWASASDIWLSEALMGGQPDSDWQAGGFNYLALIHELGHALWLEHPFEGPLSSRLPAGLDNNQYSVMSYTDHPHSLFVRYQPAVLLPDGNWSLQWKVVAVHPSTPMLLDIAAIQRLYGANMAWHTGDDVYSFDPAHPFIMSLWDAGGNDTISATNFSTDCRIDLREGQYSSLRILPDLSVIGVADLSIFELPAPQPSDYDGTDNLAIAWGAVFENAIGGSGNDWLIGNDEANRIDGGWGSDTMIGGLGDDTLTPGLGNDSIDAGAGTDTVILPMFPNVFAFTENSPSQVSGSYGTGTPYTLALNDVELARFGSDYQTTIPLSTLVSGAAQEQLARMTDLYLAFFGRAPDVGGLEYWQEQLLEVGKDFTAISKDFAFSDEAQALFPQTGSNRDFVRTVYVNCFGREPDAGGWDYWTAVLDGKGVTDLSDRGIFVGNVILGAYAPTSGPEDRTLMTNRHEAALYYVNKLSVDLAEGFDAGINTLLARVTGDPLTEDKAERVIDHVFANPVTLSGVMNDPVLLDSIWGA